MESAAKPVASGVTATNHEKAQPKEDPKINEQSDFYSFVQNPDQNIMTKEQSTDIDNDMEEDKDSSSDGEYGDYEDYPGETQPHPALHSQYKVFIDPAYTDEMKNEIWNIQGDVVFNYKLALDYWNKRSAEKDPQPMQSKADANSRLLCKEWWENTAYDFEMTRSIRAWIEEAADWELDIRVQPRIPSWTYNNALLALWREEYMASLRDQCSADPRFQGTAQLIRPFRQRAASAAASHRLIDASLRNIRSIGLLDVPLGQQNCTIPGLNANIDPCHWLSNPSRAAEPPFYLWDKAARQTVRTCDLSSVPEYLAVSHTWGRWRTNAMVVDGVPWPVPGCGKFDVQSLPDMLASMPFPEQYVWMDLFCIPQSGDDVRAKLEIANQAAIFKSASASIAWLPSVPDWEGLQYAIELIALQCFSVESELDLGSVLKLCIRKAETNAHLVDLKAKEHVKNFPANRRSYMQPWFTSLWTLQEICLRPDMLLCDKHWRPFTLSNFKVPVDHLIALLASASWNEYVAKSTSEGRDFPSGVHELLLLFQDTRIMDLPDLMPMNALILGDQRYCESRRAEAIMSVVGCTTWFHDDIHNDPGNRRLILGRYPLAFVEEMRQKLGAAFFATVDHSTGAFTDHATLLPFSTERNDGAMNMRGLLPFNSVAEDHPSVVSWVIHISGAVLLEQVGILASYPRREGSKDVYVNITGEAALDSLPVHPEGPVELHAYLASFSGEGRDLDKFAVHLMRSDGLALGLILMEEPNLSTDEENVFNGARYDLFGKVANFYYFLAEETWNSEDARPYGTIEDKKWAVL